MSRSVFEYRLQVVIDDLIYVSVAVVGISCLIGIAFLVRSVLKKRAKNSSPNEEKKE